MTHIRSLARVHNKAFLTNFEVACEAGIFALLADILWLLHDITYGGFTAWYGSIMTGLVLGLGFTILALYRHHKSYTHRLIRKQILR